MALFCRPTSEAVILGSSQRLSPCIGGDGYGTAVLRRRSGGAAVLVAPGAQCWLDVFLPAGDPLIDPDVARTAWWLGDTWAAALRPIVAEQSVLAVHRGPSGRNAWSLVACFAAVGAGEVTVDGHKLVGISQRRSASGVWLHSMALLVLDAGGIARRLVGADGVLGAAAVPAERGLGGATALAEHLASAAAALACRDGGRDDVDALEAAVLARLPPGAPDQLTASS